MKEKFKNVMCKSLDFIDKHLGIIKPIIVFLFILIGWFIFEYRLMTFFDEYIIPILSVKEFSNSYINISLIIVILVALYSVCKIIEYRYRVPLLTILLLSFFVFLYMKYRFVGLGTINYIAVPNVFWILGYTDILVFILSAVLFLLVWFLVFSKEKEEVNNDSEFLSDTPIDKPESDILGYSESAKKLASDLESIDAKTSFSIGLIAPWGTGKTSYLNLLNYYLNKNKFIVIKFNPRHSLSSKNIQEDFFEILFSELSKYDSRFSSSFTNYLKAINIFVENKMISTFLGFHKLWNKDSERDKINDAIRKINKRIVIIVDDFDRLLADEIIEIFKSIDGNASFTNFIFITAYDKKLVNDILGRLYSNKDTFFSDKFFTLEIQIPLQPYEKIYNYLLKKLLEGLYVNVEDKELYKIVLANYVELLEKYLVTIRDVKRFLNLFTRGFKQLQGEVEFDAYFLLYLVKYKYLDEYLCLSKKDYITTNIMKANHRYFLKDKLEINSKEILEKLFSETSKYSLRSINNEMAFKIYFHEFVDGLTIRKMEDVFGNTLDNAKLFIDRSISENNFNELISFLDSRNTLAFDSKNKFERFLDLLLYINCKKYDVSVPYFTILRLLYKNNREQLLEKYSYDEQEYTELIAKKIEGNYPDYPNNITVGIIIGIIRNEFLEEIILTKDRVLSIAKNALNNLIYNDTEVKQIHIDLLYSCISAIDQTTRDITLDRQACLKIKMYIEKNPAGYFNNFVRLGMISSNQDFNSVACEPFWKQIFGNENKMEALIKTNRSKIPNFRLIDNFWELYKNNGYKPIEFQNQGNVQDKINNNLEAEINDLHSLLKIENDFDKSEKFRSNHPQRTGNKEYFKKYTELLSQIDDIPLYITKRGDIRTKIEDIRKLLV